VVALPLAGNENDLASLTSATRTLEPVLTVSDVIGFSILLPIGVPFVAHGLISDRIVELAVVPL